MTAGVSPATQAAVQTSTLRRLARQRGAVVGVLILAALALVAVGAPWLGARNPIKTSPREALQPPGARFLLGSDQLGRDVASRVMHGARISLTIGLISVSIALVTGTPIGLVSGFYGGRVDAVLMRIIDVLLAFPGILLALAIVSVLSPGLNNVMIAVGLANVPAYARLTRASVLTAREQLYVEAARALGGRDAFILVRYIVPNVVAPYIILLTAQLGGAILAEAALSYLGLGAAEPTPSWGLMLSGSALSYAEKAPWIPIFPGIAISLGVFGFNLFGDSLRDALDPKLRKG